MTTTAHSDATLLARGAWVTFRRVPGARLPEGVFVVTHGPHGRERKYVVAPADGRGDPIRTSAALLVPCDENGTALADPWADPAALPTLGTVVAPIDPALFDGYRLLVVLGLARGRQGHYRLAPLGGDDGAYYRAVPLDLLRPVPLADLPDRLTA